MEDPSRIRSTYLSSSSYSLYQSFSRFFPALANPLAYTYFHLHPPSFHARMRRTVKRELCHEANRTKSISYLTSDELIVDSVVVWILFPTSQPESSKISLTKIFFNVLIIRRVLNILRLILWFQTIGYLDDDDDDVDIFNYLVIQL